MKPLENWRLTDTRLGASTNSKTSSAAMLAGIRYHKRVYKLLKMNCDLGWPGWKLYVEPWFKADKSQRLRSPDAVMVEAASGRALVIEVKKNWADGRDGKLLAEYLPIVRCAFDVAVMPLMIVGNVRGLKHEPLLSLGSVLESCAAWQLGQPTPTLLIP